MQQTGRYVKFVCPYCGEVEAPCLHTYKSTCGGGMEWRGSRIFCTQCDCEASRYYYCEACDSEIDNASNRCAF